MADHAIRMALVAAALAATALLALGYQQLSTMSSTFSRVAEDQSLTLTTQLASATAGAGREVVGVIPYTDEGLDGVVFFDAQGRPAASSGRLAGELRGLEAQAREVAQSRRHLQEFHVPARKGTKRTELRPWSPGGFVQVTIVPQGQGRDRRGLPRRVGDQPDAHDRDKHDDGPDRGRAVHLLQADADDQPPSDAARSTGWARVRRLDAEDGSAVLSRQSSPELQQQLASDIAEMHEDLTRALRESSTDPLTGIANHRAFGERAPGDRRLGRGADRPAALPCRARPGRPQADQRRLRPRRRRPSDRRFGPGADEVPARSVTCPPASAATSSRSSARAAIRSSAEDLAERIAARSARCRSSGWPASRRLPAWRRRCRSAWPPWVSSAATADELIMPPTWRCTSASSAAAKASFRGDRRGGDVGSGDVVRALALAVDAKDSGTRSRGETVSDVAVAAGRALRLDEDELERSAARRFADVGKIGTPDAVLLKQGPLDDDEVRIMKEHPGWATGSCAPRGCPTARPAGSLHHHEHLDGNGYPRPAR